TNQYNDYSASYSNYSDLYIDLFAPGTFYSTTMYGGYDTLSGTSFAAPMVAGTAALIKSKYPAMRAPEIKQLIIKNVDEKLIELGNKCISKGRLNAFKALSGEHLLFGGGTGDPSTPYQIWDEHHLSNIGVVSSKHFILMDDITLPYMDQPYGMPTWKPIPEFSGYLDGNGKTVSNLCVWEASTNSDGIGLFATNTGTIANLHIIGKVGAVGENTSVGMVSGYNYGIIENITVTNDYGTNVVINNYSSSYSGGITGFNYNPGIIQNCIVNGDVYSTGVRGSFAGFNFYGTISSNTHNGQLLP
ncbi:MAG: S8 family serine peptidase, partial [Treponema sp.]|nr:S8 family serine peptidase [Treponema sp.]